MQKAATIRERLSLNDSYAVEYRILPGLPRPIYSCEIVFVLLDKKEGKEIFHISNCHQNDGLKRLNGHPTLRRQDGSRLIFLNLSECSNPQNVSFQSLKDNFIDEACKRISEEYRPILETKLKEVTLP